MSELQSGIMKATESKPTVVKTEAQIKSKLEAGNKAAVQKMKIDKLRKDVLKEIENRKNEDYIGNIIDPEDYGFRVSDGTLTDEVEEIMEMLIRDKKAYGGVAGMLGERTGDESGRRAGQTARQKRKASPTDWYTDKIIADNLGRIKSDMFLKYILPERNLRWFENITDEDMYGTYDEDSGYSGIVRGDFITKDGKRIEFPAPADKGLDVEGLLEVLDKHDEGSVSKDHNVNKHLKKVIELKGGGLAPLLGEPTYTDENHRVPFSKGKFGEWTAKGLAALIEKLFPKTTKLGKTSKPMAEKTQLRKAIADFQERQKAKKADPFSPDFDFKAEADLIAKTPFTPVELKRLFGNQIDDNILREIAAMDPAEQLKAIEEVKFFIKSRKNLKQELMLRDFDVTGKKGHASGGIIGRVPYWKGGSWNMIKEAIKHNKIFGLGGPPYKPGATSFDIKKLTKDRFGTELSLQELKEMGIKKEGFSKFLTGFKEYKADVIKQQLLDSKQNAQIRIKVSKDMLKKNPEDVMTKKISSQMIRDAEKQLKDLDAALKDIDIYKAMKEKTGVASHATGGRVSLSSGGLAGMLGE